ncbi:YjaG family protein [Alteromonas sp. AMM-1]|uniref:YjaG family protein n=1 Tax=Alteromonas sp. AMM-1 TaxID=3394233 RepID=UPI0039A757BA
MLNNKLSTFAQVRALEGRNAIAFSVALLDRMVPNYQLFCEVTEFGDPTVLSHCLNLMWEVLANPKSKVNFATQLEKVEEATPDTNDFDNYGVYPAIDAAIAMSATINLILKEDPQGAVVVSKLSQGSVEAYLLATGEATDETVKTHPLMQFEIAIQQELLDAVQSDQPWLDMLKTLKDIAASEGISNIGIERD